MEGWGMRTCSQEQHHVHSRLEILRRHFEGGGRHAGELRPPWAGAARAEEPTRLPLCEDRRMAREGGTLLTSSPILHNPQHPLFHKKLWPAHLPTWHPGPAAPNLLPMRQPSSQPLRRRVPGPRRPLGRGASRPGARVPRGRRIATWSPRGRGSRGGTSGRCRPLKGGGTIIQMCHSMGKGQRCIYCLLGMGAPPILA